MAVVQAVAAGSWQLCVLDRVWVLGREAVLCVVGLLLRKDLLILCRRVER